MPAIEIQPVPTPFRRMVRVPGSKSITNRALILAALGEDKSLLWGALASDDTQRMIEALQALGYAVGVEEKDAKVTVTGRGAAIPPGKGRVLMCGNSGTTIRFLAAMLAAGPGEYVLDGVARMRQRPIGQLVDQLAALGARLEYAGQEGFPPLRMCAAGGLAGGMCAFSGVQSSQYISAVLMAAPYARSAVRMTLVGPVTSEPYVRMTLRMMEQFGVKVAQEDGPEGSRVLRVPLGRYTARSYEIEPDASNASYFMAAAALVPGASVTLPGLARASLQGDVGFADVLAGMGAVVGWGRGCVVVEGPIDGRLRGIDVDLNTMPDMVQTLAVVALFARGPTTVRNVGNLRVKETDRLAALETELRKFGAAVETGADWIRVTPPDDGAPALRGATVATYDDHRMAMALALAGLRLPGVRIEDPECVGETYPGYFADLAAAVHG